MTSGTLNRVDHYTGYSVDQFGTRTYFDLTPTDSITFDGIEDIAILGPQGSEENFTVTGNTASNLSITTGTYSNSVSMTAPVPTSRRGSLSITGVGNTDVTLNTGTLDFPSLQIQAGNGELTLDDSQSKSAHHYVIDQGSITRDGVVFNISAFGLTLSGGLGNDMFDFKASTTALSFSFLPQTTINGGPGNDTFNLAHDVQEGTSTPRRSPGWLSREPHRRRRHGHEHPRAGRFRERACACLYDWIEPARWGRERAPLHSLHSRPTPGGDVGKRE